MLSKYYSAPSSEQHSKLTRTWLVQYLLALTLYAYQQIIAFPYSSVSEWQGKFNLKLLLPSGEIYLTHLYSTNKLINVNPITSGYTKHSLVFIELLKIIGLNTQSDTQYIWLLIDSNYWFVKYNWEFGKTQCKTYGGFLNKKSNLQSTRKLERMWTLTLDLSDINRYIHIFVTIIYCKKSWSKMFNKKSAQWNIIIRSHFQANAGCKIILF